MWGVTGTVADERVFEKEVKEMGRPWALFGRHARYVGPGSEDGKGKLVFDFLSPARLVQVIDAVNGLDKYGAILAGENKDQIVVSVDLSLQAAAAYWCSFCLDIGHSVDACPVARLGATAYCGICFTRHAGTQGARSCKQPKKGTSAARLRREKWNAAKRYAVVAIYCEQTKEKCLPSTRDLRIVDDKGNTYLVAESTESKSRRAGMSRITQPRHCTLCVDLGIQEKHKNTYEMCSGTVSIKIKACFIGGVTSMPDAAPITCPYMHGYICT